eukprot:tig00021348_g20550.t1
MSAWDLFLAVKKGDLAETQKILTQGIHPDVADWDDRRVIHMAANYGHRALLELLLQSGAEKNIQDKWGVTALHEACMNNFPELAMILVDVGADLNIRDSQNRTPLDVASEELRSKLIERSLRHVSWEMFHAARAGNVDTLKHLVESGRVSLDIQDWDARAPIHLAAEYGHAGMMTWMLKQGADKNVPDKWGVTPLHEACKHDHVEIALALLEAGADMAAKDSNAKTPLEYASAALRATLEEKLDLWNSAGRGDLETVKNILESRSTAVDATDAAGNTALFSAAGAGHVEIVQFLLERGANINFQNKRGETALITACKRRMDATTTALIDAGADVQVATEEGETALFHALKHRRARVVALLSKRGARLSLQEAKPKALIRDAVGENDVEFFGLLDENGVALNEHLLVELLILAARFAADQIVAMCVQRGCEVNARDDRLRSALHEAAEFGHDGLVRVLIEQYRADINARDADGATPLALATQNGHHGVAVVLLRHDAAADFKSPVFQTLLKLAVERGVLVCAGLLVERGVDVSWEVVALVEGAVEAEGLASPDAVEDLGTVEHFYERVLLKAAELGRTRAVGLLLQNNVDVGYADDTGATALHAAAGRGHVAVIERLLRSPELGAGVDARDSKGRTPLIRAAQEGQVEACRLLVEKGRADAGVADAESGRSALAWAVLYRHVEVVEFLCKQGGGRGALVPDAAGFTPYDWALVVDTVERMRRAQSKAAAEAAQVQAENSLHGGNAVAAAAAAAAAAAEHAREEKGRAGAGPGAGQRLLQPVIAVEAVWRLRRKFALRTVWKTSALYLAWTVLLTVTASVGFTQNREDAFYFAESVRDLLTGAPEFEGSERGGARVSWDSVVTIEDLWGYLQGPFLESMFVESWYPGSLLSPEDRGFVYYQHRLLGRVRLRQLRIRDDSCAVPGEFLGAEGTLGKCYGEWGPSTEDRRPFGAGPAFEYSPGTAPPLGAAHIPGVVPGRLGGGGFVADLPTDLAAARALLADLRANRWVDWQTYAVLAEFNLYNANVGLAGVARLAFYMPSTGAIRPSLQFTTMRLRRAYSAFDALYAILALTVALVALYYVALEVLAARRLRLAYLANPSNYYACFMHAVMLAVIVYRCVFEYLVYAIDWRPQDETYVDLSYAADVYGAFADLIAVVLVLAWLKTLIFIRLFPVVGPIVQAIFNTFVSPPVLTFSAVYGIVIVAFSLAMHVAFGSSVYIFRTLEWSLLTMFRITFGDFTQDMEALQQAGSVAGPLLLAAFVTAATLVLINLFIAIFTESYRRAQGMRVGQWNQSVSELMQREPRIAHAAEEMLATERAVLAACAAALARRLSKKRFGAAQGVGKALRAFKGLGREGPGRAPRGPAPAPKGFNAAKVRPPPLWPPAPGSLNPRLESAERRAGAQVHPASEAHAWDEEAGEGGEGRRPSVLGSLRRLSRRMSHSLAAGVSSAVKMVSGGDLAHPAPPHAHAAEAAIAGGPDREEAGRRLGSRSASMLQSRGSFLLGAAGAEEAAGGATAEIEARLQRRPRPRRPAPAAPPAGGDAAPAGAPGSAPGPGSGALPSSADVARSEGTAALTRMVGDVELNLIGLKVGLERALAEQGDQVHRMKRTLESLALLQTDRIANVQERMDAMAAAHRRQIGGLSALIADLARSAGPDPDRRPGAWKAAKGPGAPPLAGAAGLGSAVGGAAAPGSDASRSQGGSASAGATPPGTGPRSKR